MLISCRRSAIKLLFIALLFLAVVNYILFFGDYGKPKHYEYEFRRSPLAIQQTGNYWIINNYLRSRPLDAPNKTVTLTTHATYKDFVNMELLILRWSAPVSLTIFANGDDFEQTMICLYHILHCTYAQDAFERWVSVHLVIHREHLPKQFRYFAKSQLANFDCSQPLPYASPLQEDTYWHKKNLLYPINLLRNVARCNAESYYVFPIDPVQLPSINFANRFIKFAENHMQRKPLKSIYCMPIFPQLSSNNIPFRKDELLIYIANYLLGRYRLNVPKKQLQNWIRKEVTRGKISQYNVTNDDVWCSAYVSINSLEPLYDERFFEEMYDIHSIRLQVLSALDYDFVILDGTFLIHRLTDTWKGMQLEELTNRKLEPNDLHDLKKLYNATL